jgi:hydroxyethylthiazole kinase-like sugar kinase family protein
MGNLPPTAPDKPSQIPVEHFLPEFSKFTLTLVYQNGTLVKHFTQQQIVRALDLANNASHPRIINPVGVVPR